MTEAKRPVTRAQYFAQRAFRCVNRRRGKDAEEYSRFAKRFPSLIHSCGLAQALAFAQVKAPEVYLEDVTEVLNHGDRKMFLTEARRADVLRYITLTRETIEAASWLKRYAEALLDRDDDAKGDDDGNAGMS